MVHGNDLIVGEVVLPSSKEDVFGNQKVCFKPQLYLVAVLIYLSVAQFLISLNRIMMMVIIIMIIIIIIIIIIVIA